MRRLALSLTTLAVLAVPASAGAPSVVNVDDDFFKPTKVTIVKGDSVVWKWKGSDQHNVALMKPGSDRVKRRSSVKRKGRFQHEFGVVGRWRALCEIHPETMLMKVVVKRP